MKERNRDKRSKLLYAVDENGRALGLKDMARDLQLPMEEVEALVNQLEALGLVVKRGRRLYMTFKGELTARAAEGGTQ